MRFILWITPWKTSPTWSHLSYSLCHFQMFLVANRKEQWGSQRQRLYHPLCRARSDESIIFHKVPARQAKEQRIWPSGLSLVITLPGNKDKNAKWVKKIYMNYIGNRLKLDSRHKASYRYSTIALQNFAPLSKLLSHRDTKGLSMKILLEAIIWLRLRYCGYKLHAK